MKQRTGSSVSSYSTRENEVAEILVKLRSFILEFGCVRGILPQSWGRKKKRSVISANPKAEEASSPATPLSFSPSESDENPTSLFRRNVSLKRVFSFSFYLLSFIFNLSNLSFFFCVSSFVLVICGFT